VALAHRLTLVLGEHTIDGDRLLCDRLQLESVLTVHRSLQRTSRLCFFNDIAPRRYEGKRKSDAGDVRVVE
jgi:hypothetical protein